MEQFAKNLHEEFEVDEMISTEAIVVQACVDYFNETGDLKPTSGDISKVMPLRNPNAKEDKDKYYSSSYIGRMLSRMGFKRGREIKKRYYALDAELLAKLCERYQLSMDETKNGSSESIKEKSIPTD